jgi:Kef-type K+ transport system membrane component KefB
VPEFSYFDLLLVAGAAVIAPLALDLLSLRRVPPIVAEITAGALIGPSVLGIAEVDEPVRVLSQIGLVFLFFLAGLELDLRRAGGLELRLVAIAFAGSLTLALGVAHALAGADLVEAPLLIAILLAATAFGIVVAVLKDADETRTRFGQLVIAAASLADLATVVLLSLLFSRNGSGAGSAALLLGLFVVLSAAIALALHGAQLTPRLGTAVMRLQETTAQLGVRTAFVVLIAFVALAEELGLEVVLGAFLSGAILRALDPQNALARSDVAPRLEAIGFGIFIPIFFVASGMQLELGALVESPADIALVPAILVSLLLARAVPALLYRPTLGGRAAVAAGLLQATSLPFIVAASQIGVELGHITTGTAAGLVAGGALSVLLFPALALRLLDPRARHAAGPGPGPEPVEAEGL